MKARERAMQARHHPALVMIKPNTSEDVPQDMLSLARRTAPCHVRITALTARSGVALILDAASAAVTLALDRAGFGHLASQTLKTTEWNSR